jgi:hypothetical protein
VRNFGSGSVFSIGELPRLSSKESFSIRLNFQVAGRLVHPGSREGLTPVKNGVVPVLEPSSYKAILSPRVVVCRPATIALAGARDYREFAIPRLTRTRR